MSAERNSYFFSRIAVWISTGSMPSVTIACSSFCVDELACRTCPTNYELISRHISRIDKVETFRVNMSMLPLIWQAMHKLSGSVRRGTDEYLEQEKAGSNWFFQARENGWIAMYDGQPNDVRAFQRWLCNVMA